MSALKQLRNLVAKFEKGKSVDVAKYLRDHDNPEAADQWEAMNEKYKDKLKKQGVSHFVDPFALEMLKYDKPDRKAMAFVQKLIDKAGGDDKTLSRLAAQAAKGSRDYTEVYKWFVATDELLGEDNDVADIFYMRAESLWSGPGLGTFRNAGVVPGVPDGTGPHGDTPECQMCQDLDPEEALGELVRLAAEKQALAQDTVDFAEWAANQTPMTKGQTISVLKAAGLSDISPPRQKRPGPRFHVGDKVLISASKHKDTTTAGPYATNDGKVGTVVQTDAKGAMVQFKTGTPIHFVDAQKPQKVGILKYIEPFTLQGSKKLEIIYASGKPASKQRILIVEQYRSRGEGRETKVPYLTGHAFSARYNKAGGVYFGLFPQQRMHLDPQGNKTEAGFSATTINPDVGKLYYMGQVGKRPAGWKAELAAMRGDTGKQAFEELRILARTSGYHDAEGKALSSADLAWIKKVAKVMNLGWQSIASRPAHSKILLEAKKKGKSAEEAAEASKTSKKADWKPGELNEEEGWEPGETIDPEDRFKPKPLGEGSMIPGLEERMAAELEPWTFTAALTLGKKDKAVLDAFLDKKEATGTKLHTDGTRLDGLWSGGTGIAKWKGGKIEFTDLGSKAAQTVQNAIKKKAPANWLKSASEAQTAMAELEKMAGAKTAATSPSGMYGYTKKVQADCESAQRKLSLQAKRIAKQVFRKDERTAAFLAAHAERAESVPAKLLLAALQDSIPKFASMGKQAGYTHYWETKREIEPSEWRLVVKVAKAIVAKAKRSGIAVAGGSGTGSPKFTNNYISLNGAQPDDYETFYLERAPASFAFCKTAQKPYDAVVVSILAATRKILPDTFKVSSDGGPSAIKMVLGYTSNISGEAEELKLFIDNDGQLYRGPIAQARAAAEKFADRAGAFDPKKGYKFWWASVTKGAKKYASEIGGTFTPAQRKECAIAMAEDWWQEHQIHGHRSANHRLAELREQRPIEAAHKYGLYGFPTKTANLGLKACFDLRELAGQVAADLHVRRASQYDLYTGFLQRHADEGSCAYSRLLRASYPSQSTKLARQTPSTVAGWIALED